MIAWTKQKDAWNGIAGPYAMNVSPKGDGRWNWSITAEGAMSPEASGVAQSAGAAKGTCEQYVKRSGRV